MTAIVPRAKKPVLSPCTAGSTAETVGLYTYLQELSGTSSWCVGTADYYRFTAFAPAWSNYQESFRTMTGKLPAFLQLEYVDALAVPAQNANLKEDILNVYRSGGFVTLHHHPANPAVYSFTTPSNATNVADRTGSPVTACLDGGSKRADFLAYCDRFAAFLNSLTIGGVKVPIIVRWFHEINGAFFWWNGADRQVGAVQLYKDFIDRLRAQGVNNALYSLNFEVSSADSTIANWYLGDTYLDFVSGDYYGKLPAPTYPFADLEGLRDAQEYTRMLAMGKPFYWAEIGFQASMNRPKQWSKNIGGDMQLYPAASMAGMWVPYNAAGAVNAWAPWPGGGADADLRLMTDDPRCITRERVTFRPFAR